MPVLHVSRHSMHLLFLCILSMMQSTRGFRIASVVQGAKEDPTAIAFGATNPWTSHSYAVQYKPGDVVASVQCKMQRLVQDDFATAPKHFDTCINEENGQQVTLSFGGEESPRIFTGDTSIVTGIIQPDNESSLRVISYAHTSSSKATGTFHAAEADGRGGQVDLRTVIVFVPRFRDGLTFIDSGIQSSADQQQIVSLVKETLFGDDPASVHNAFKTCSWGKMELVPSPKGNVFPVNIPSVCRPHFRECFGATYDITKDFQAGEWTDDEWMGIMKASIGYVEQFHRGLVVADEFMHKTLVMPSKLIDFVGMGHLGCHTWISQAYLWQQVWLHELGHNLGLGHSGTKIPDTDEPVEAEYGDTSGAMGFVLPEGYARCFNGPHAVQLGWVTPSLSLDKDTLLRRQPIVYDLPNLSISNMGTISVKTNWLKKNEQIYFLEHKTTDLQGQLVPEKWTKKLIIKEAAPAERSTLASKVVGLLEVGEAWLDPSETLKIVLKSLDEKSATVKIVRRARRRSRRNN